MACVFVSIRHALKGWLFLFLTSVSYYSYSFWSPHQCSRCSFLLKAGIEHSRLGRSEDMCTFGNSNQSHMDWRCMLSHIRRLVFCIISKQENAIAMCISNDFRYTWKHHIFSWVHISSCHINYEILSTHFSLPLATGQGEKAKTKQKRQWSNGISNNML